jgi:hypothetical protein
MLPHTFGFYRLSNCILFPFDTVQIRNLFSIEESSEPLAEQVLGCTLAFRQIVSLAPRFSARSGKKNSLVLLQDGCTRFDVIGHTTLLSQQMSLITVRHKILTLGSTCCPTAMQHRHTSPITKNMRCMTDDYHCSGQVGRAHMITWKSLGQYVIPARNPEDHSVIVLLLL